METLQFVLGILIWFLCPVLLLLILLQGGAGDMSSSFGGGGQIDASLGVGAGRKMSKLTGWLTVAFLLIVLALAIPHHGSLKTSAPAGDGTAASAGAPKTETGKAEAGQGVTVQKVDASTKTEETAKPATESTKPATETAKPATEPAKPATEVAKPATEPAKPATEAAKPAETVSPAAPPASKPAIELGNE